MKRFYIAAVAGLCWGTVGSAQEGTLAPTVPVVPPPVLQQNGSLAAPPSGVSWGTSGTSGARMFSRTTWSPVRSPVVAGEMNYTAPMPAGYVVPPLPPGVGSVGAPCGPTGCAAPHGTCWSRFKAWLKYHPSPTELPRFHLAQYVTPIQGAFGGPGSCCANGSQLGYAPPPQPGFVPPPPPVLPQPAAPGPVAMPARGTQGTVPYPTWQGRVAPAPTDTGSRPAQPTYGGVVNTGGYLPNQK